MTFDARSERALVLAPQGRDAQVAAKVLGSAGLESTVCADLTDLVAGLGHGAGVALIVEEALHNQDYAGLAHWIEAQPPWSDFPIIVFTRRGGGAERNPAAGRFIQALGAISFLERPFHPTTLVSVVQTALRGRRRQYDARERLETLRSAVSRQAVDQEHLRLMVNELNHRVKNTLATVQSIVAQTLRGEDIPLRVRETLTSRILALSKAHDVLTDEQWAGANLREIAHQAAQPFRAGAGDERLVLTGPEVRLPPKMAIAVALAFHELATNAVKYGALSGPEGRVDFGWRREGSRLHMLWQESGGPTVSPPSRRGFGTRLIERGLAADLQGAVELAYPPTGVVCRITADLASNPTAPLAPPHPGAADDDRSWDAANRRLGPSTGLERSRFA
ncbi:HWE histidine kinase domain-containing protein [uncultured Phenylobacterium sp.]|uniref:sensor histidine kinase n=1 Tax=uncultured Phenylobacterium sp. TaxID=349273 RepID=UPI0025F64058|nr:HWE histidine kinase domain-containing protein [uncultured Phenylobacterium sp.]